MYIFKIAMKMVDLNLKYSYKVLFVCAVIFRRFEASGEKSFSSSKFASRLRKREERREKREERRKQVVEC